MIDQTELHQAIYHHYTQFQNLKFSYDYLLSNATSASISTLKSQHKLISSISTQIKSKQKSKQKPKQKPAIQPNILLLFPDQWRFDWTNNKHNSQIKLNLPNLDYMALHGISFTHVIVPSPVCAPSRSCLVTGREYDNQPVQNNAADTPNDYATVYQILRDVAGYYVMTSGKDDLTKAHGIGGLAGDYRLKQLGFNNGSRIFGKQDGRKHYTQDPYNQWVLKNFGEEQMNFHKDCMIVNHDIRFDCMGAGEKIDDKAYIDRYIQDKSIELVQNYLDYGGINISNKSNVSNLHYGNSHRGFELTRDHNVSDDGNAATNKVVENVRPWFLQVNYAGPHAPYVVTTSMLERYKNSIKSGNRTRKNEIVIPKPIGINNISNESNAKVQSDWGDHLWQFYQRSAISYALMIENIDTYIGEWIEFLRERGILENTMICLSSDHGELLGYYGWYDKYRPFSASMMVPLVCMYENGIKKNVNIVDKPVALLDLYGTFIDYAISGVNKNKLTTQTLEQIDIEYELGYKSLKNVFETGSLDFQVNEDINNGYNHIKNKYNVSVYSNYDRNYVSSGLGVWRAVVKKISHDKLYKLICYVDECKDCSQSLRMRSSDRFRFHKHSDSNSSTNGVSTGRELLVYNLQNDLYEQHNIVKKIDKHELKMLFDLLPPGFC